MDPILTVSNLSITFPHDNGQNMAVRDVSFTLERGKTLGFVGESGCGKSVTAYACLRLVPNPGRIVSGEILFNNRDVLAMNDEELRAMRGGQASMIFQEPMTSLNPVFTVGWQIAESLRFHRGMNRREALDEACSLLTTVGIPDALSRYHAYPHEFSGGMRQRAMIAMALASSPSLLIADEPTTALDVTIQAQILDLLLRLQEERRMSLILITHDLGIVANLADHVAIMYAGEIVEYGRTKDVFTKPGHPYTRGLFAARPAVGVVGKRLATIPGMVPAVSAAPSACVFAPRCSLAIDACREAPVSMTVDRGGRAVRCIRFGGATGGGIGVRRKNSRLSRGRRSS